MTAGFPPELDTTFDIEENDADSGYGFARRGPAGPETQTEAPAQILQERTVKAYLVKYTAYNTFVGARYTKCRIKANDVQPLRDYMVYLLWRDFFLSV